jgi:hypothetical membrane protein
MTFDIFHICGLCGIALAILAVIYPASLYRGKRGERYSLLNHFISELGEVGVSRAARVFNAGLFLAGLLILPYIIGLGISFGSVLGWIGTAAGVVAALGVAAVGLFPMNNLDRHAVAAITYFRAGLGMVLVFGLAILFPPGKTIVPKAAALLSLAAVLAYGTFLTLPWVKKGEQRPADTPDPQQEPERPRLSALASLEWLVFFTTIAWMLGMAFFI